MADVTYHVAGVFDATKGSGLVRAADLVAARAARSARRVGDALADVTDHVAGVFDAAKGGGLGGGGDYGAATWQRIELRAAAAGGMAGGAGEGGVRRNGARSRPPLPRLRLLVLLKNLFWAVVGLALIGLAFEQCDLTTGPALAALGLSLVALGVALGYEVRALWDERGASRGPTSRLSSNGFTQKRTPGLHPSRPLAQWISERPKTMTEASALPSLPRHDARPLLPAVGGMIGGHAVIGRTAAMRAAIRVQGQNRIANNRAGKPVLLLRRMQ